MAKEIIEDRKLTGNVNVSCKYDDGTVRMWTERKEVIIANIVAIVNRYRQQGLTLTLRQLHYQLVTRNQIVNHDSAYKKLGNILDDCRYAGVIDWNAIEDRGRVPYIPYSADDIADGFNDLKYSYRLDRQQGQKNYIELWSEKDALSGILRRVTEEFHIQLVINKGYTSSSAVHVSYKRLADKILEGKKVTILYFGDHDPSGLDMVRDITDRLSMFLCRGERLRFNSDFMYDKVEAWMRDEDIDQYWLLHEEYISQEFFQEHQEGIEDEQDWQAACIKAYLHENDLFEVEAIGLSKAQIKQFSLPPNPTKLTDSRAKEYIKRHGKICWEVDALQPETLISIVRENIMERIDTEVYEARLQQETDDKAELDKLIEQYRKDNDLDN